MPRIAIAPLSLTPEHKRQRIELTNADRVIDRFIPRASTVQTFRAVLNGGGLVNSPLQDRSPWNLTSPSDMQPLPEDQISLSLIDGHIQARPNVFVSLREMYEQWLLRGDELNMISPTLAIPLVLPPMLQHRGAMADALRISIDSSRILNYCRKSSLGAKDTLTEGGEKKELKRKPKIKTIFPYKVLSSPQLRDDFYCNLVSWSSKTDRIAVGLHKLAFIYSEQVGSLPLKPFSNSTITSVAFSTNELIAIGDQDGGLAIYDEKTKFCKCVTGGQSCIYCICWLPNNKGFFTGMDSGKISYYELKQSQNGLELIRIWSIAHHSQQVCGMSISNDMKQLAVGCNDNSCSIWDIKDKKSPFLQFLLPHHAAVKAIAYCPWSTALLATGGGSKDRTIRFWHSNTGTLLNSFNTKGQITGLIWSPSKKQIAATFGFTSVTEPSLLSVYSYPKLEVSMQAPATVNSRVLSAVASPDGRSICFAANDETVRFYELWSHDDNDLSPDLQEEGIFGSELLELSESVVRSPTSLR